MSKQQQPAPATAPTAPEAPTAPAVERFVSDYPQISYPTAPGGGIQFAGGVFETSDPEQIAFLLERDTCHPA